MITRSFYVANHENFEEKELERRGKTKSLDFQVSITKASFVSSYFITGFKKSSLEPIWVTVFGYNVFKVRQRNINFSHFCSQPKTWKLSYLDLPHKTYRLLKLTNTKN